MDAFDRKSLGFVVKSFIVFSALIYIKLLRTGISPQTKWNRIVQQNLNVTSVSRYMHCDLMDEAFLIKSFNLTESNCYEKRLKIQFLFQLNNESDAKLITAYITDEDYDKSYTSYKCMSTHQNHSDYCKKIKRFRLNDANHWVLIDEHPHLVETKQMDHLIEMKLLKKSNIFVYAMFKLDYYDTLRNEILYAKIWKHYGAFTFNYFLVVQYGSSVFLFLRKHLAFICFAAVIYMIHSFRLLIGDESF